MGIQFTFLGYNGNNAIFLSGSAGENSPSNSNVNSKYNFNTKFIGDFNSSVTSMYLPRKNGGGAGPDTTTPTGISIYNGSTWTDAYSATAVSMFKTAAASSTRDGAWLGTVYSQGSTNYYWLINSSGEYSKEAAAASRHATLVCFTINKNIIKVSGTTLYKV